MKRRILLVLLSAAMLFIPAHLIGCEKTDEHHRSAFTVEKAASYNEKGALKRRCLDKDCSLDETLYLKASTGLAYRERDEKIYVAGKGDCRDPILYISSKTPDGRAVYGIDESAFLDDATITDLVVEEGIQCVESGAFAGCTALTSVSLPAGMRVIESSAFLFCEKLISVVLPRELEQISANTFDGCVALIDIALPERLKTIGYCAFNRCTSLENVIFPDTLERIGTLAFCDCTSLASCSLPTGLKTLSEYAFAGCSALSRVDLPRSLETLGGCAFFRCSSLAELFLPKTVKNVLSNDGMSPFYASNPDLVIKTDASEKPDGWDASFNVFLLPDVGQTNSETVYLTVQYDA